MVGEKKPKFQIKQFKHAPRLDPEFPHKTWRLLEAAIHEIFNHNASGLSYEELYRNAYNLVLHKHAQMLYDNLTATLSRRLQQAAVEVDQAQGPSQFLKEIDRKWGDHLKSMGNLRDILMYMDRTWVNNNKKIPTHELGLHLWRDKVVRNSKIQERLRVTVLKMIEADRNEEVADRILIRSIAKMLMDLGPEVYQNDFENYLLRSTSDYYRAKANVLISTASCPEYLKKCEKWLYDELERIRHCLDCSSEEKLLKAIETEILEQHAVTLAEMENSGLVALIKGDHYDDIARMYVLFRKINELSIMREVMMNHLKETGKSLVEDVESCNDPITYTKNLLALRDKYEQIINNALQKDESFQHTLHNSFKYFINLNQRSPEFLSLYIDELLRKGLRGSGAAAASSVATSSKSVEDDMDKMFDRVMALFRYLQDKDVFEKYYKNHLAKRLLYQRLVSEDNEKAMIMKLRTECGYQFTSKLEGMFLDMRTSEDCMTSFRKAIEAGKVSEQPFDLNVQVLTTGSWPAPHGSKGFSSRDDAMGNNTVSTAEGGVFSAELWKVCEAFQDHYLKNHSGRRLTWQASMGTADLEISFTARKHILTVSTYQMMILLLFNSTEKLSYTEIKNATDIPEEELKRNLQSLACVKTKNVLRKMPMSKDINESDEFCCNESFTNKHIKVKIGTISINSSKESEAENTETHQKVEEDRKPQVEAALVRIMKARRVMNHNDLIAEVNKQLSQRFNPTPAFVKRRIESLIERDYIERDKNDRKLYRYLA